MNPNENQAAMRKIAMFGALAMAPIVIAIIVWAILTYLHAQKSAAFNAIHDAKPPMTVAAVESILGKPARIEHSESTGLTGDVYHYPASSRDMKITFINGTVFDTAIIPQS
jgi:hypothetical protein